MINLYDKSLIVTYLQIYLKELCPAPMYYDKDQETFLEYEGTSTVPVKKLNVTGKYDMQTYIRLATLIANWYPNEGFPFYYDKNENDEYVKVEYDKSKNNLKEILDEVLNTYNIEITDENYPEEKPTTITDRIMSYIFEVVVTKNSEPDLIYEVQKLIYGDQTPRGVARGVYSTIEDKIKKVQQDYIDNYEKVGLPTQFKGFKVTGYTDPWTEVLLGGTK